MSAITTHQIHREILEALHPRVFTNPTVGGGTSVDVAREIGVEAHRIYLHSGFNILPQRILEAFGKAVRPGDFASALSQHRGL
jgi:hypothetical protein